MKIIQQHLAVSQYYREAVTKKNIVLHHTVSSTARSALTWWATDPRRVATAYVIDKDGTIYEAFPPEYWAHHLGLTTSRNTELNRRSVGIEIANEGPLKQMANGTYRWNFGPGLDGVLYKGAPVAKAYRGYSFWAPYTDAQYVAVNELLTMLLEKLDLKPTITAHLDFAPDAPDKYSIYTHCNVRRDKSDLSPAFDFSRIQLPVLA